MIQVEQIGVTTRSYRQLQCPTSLGSCVTLVHEVNVEIIFSSSFLLRQILFMTPKKHCSLSFCSGSAPAAVNPIIVAMRQYGKGLCVSTLPDCPSWRNGDSWQRLLGWRGASLTPYHSQLLRTRIIAYISYNCPRHSLRFSIQKTSSNSKFRTTRTFFLVSSC